MDLYYGKTNLTPYRDFQCFFIVEHSCSEEFIRNQALTLLTSQCKNVDFYGAYSKKLTQATKNQLEALGIPYDRNITEEEGKRLIKAHEAQKQENSNNNLFQNNQGTNDLFENVVTYDYIMFISVYFVFLY